MSKQEVNPAYVEALHKKIEALEERVDDLESGGEGSPSSSGWGDRRDQAVIATLEMGETYSSPELHDRYRAETDIRNKKTLKQRVREIKRSGLLEPVGYGAYEFRGEER